MTMKLLTHSLHLIRTAIITVGILFLFSGCSAAPAEKPQITTVPFQDNLESAYNAVCCYLPLRMSNRFEETNYRDMHVSFENLSSEYILSIAFNALPTHEREIIVADAGVYSEYGYKDGDVVTENIEYTVYPVSEFENAVKDLFGPDAKVSFSNFRPESGVSFTYDGERFLQWNSQGDGDFGVSDFSVVLKAETDGEYVYVYDKFISLDYDVSDAGYPYVRAVYSDSMQTDLIAEGNEIPYKYTSAYTREIGQNDNIPADSLFSGLFDLSSFDTMMQQYRHTFVQAENGTYYWVSSEPVFE